MFISTQRVCLHPDYASAFEEKFVERPRRVDRFAGFVRNEVLRPLTTGAPYAVLTHWQSRGGFDAWEADRANHTRKHPLPREAYQGMATECHTLLECPLQRGEQPAKSASIWVLERYTAGPAYHSQLENGLTRTATGAEKQTGFLRLELLRPVQKEAPHIRLSCWSSPAAAQMWLASLPPATAFGSEVTADIELHKLILSSEFGG